MAYLEVITIMGIFTLIIIFSLYYYFYNKLKKKDIYYDRDTICINQYKTLTNGYGKGIVIDETPKPNGRTVITMKPTDQKSGEISQIQRFGIPTHTIKRFPKGEVFKNQELHVYQTSNPIDILQMIGNNTTENSKITDMVEFMNSRQTNQSQILRELGAGISGDWRENISELIEANQKDMQKPELSHPPKPKKQ